MHTPPRLHARSFGAALLRLGGGAAQAALSCNGSGSAVGNFTCTRIVTFGPQATDLANAILTFDKWTSSASAGFTQTPLAVDWGIGGSVNSSITVTNNAPTSQSFSLGQIETFNCVAGSGAPVAFLPGGLLGTGNGGTQGFTLAPGASRSYVVSMAAVGGGGAANLTGFTGPGRLSGAGEHAEQPEHDGRWWQPHAEHDEQCHRADDADLQLPRCCGARGAERAADGRRPGGAGCAAPQATLTGTGRVSGGPVGPVGPRR